MKTRHEKKSFRYKERDAGDTRKRASQSGGMYDSIYKSNCPVLTLKEDDYNLRPMPPTWDDPKHFALDVWVHYNVGPDNQKYLCLSRMKGEPCPICEEKKQLEKEGDTETAKKLAPSKLVAGWWINRDEEENGPVIWGCPWTIDRDIANLSYDKKSGSLICVDNPDEGYDISFSRMGKGLKTKYSGLQIARRPSPLSDDSDTQEQWLQFITDNPIPDCLNFFDYEYIAGVFSAQPKSDDDEDDEDEDERPAKKGKGKPAKKAKRPARDEDEDDDEDDEPVRRPAKSKVKSRRDEDEDEDDEDEDDEPVRKPAKKAKRPARDEDEDDDEDEDSPYEEDRPAKRFKAKARHDEDDDEDEEEDERPTRGDSRKGKKSKTRPSDDDDEDEDEDERPAKKRSVRGRIKDAF